MATGVHSSPARRRLGRLLKQAREGAGQSINAVAAALEIGRARLYRIEAGEAPVRRIEALALCDMYGVSDDIREAILALAPQTKAESWWEPYRNAVPEWFHLYLGLEAESARLRQFAPFLIPDLLQSSEYAAEVLRTDTDDALAGLALLSARHERGRSRELDVILDETVLMRPIADASGWCRQLALLAKASRQEHVTLRVLRADAGLHSVLGSGAFTIFDLRGASAPTVYRPGFRSADYLDRPADVAPYESAWEQLESRALDPMASADLLDALLGAEQ